MSDQAIPLHGEGIDYFARVGELTSGLDGAEVIRGFLAGIKEAPFDPAEPLPPMRSHGKNPRDSWEPAARRYKDIETVEMTEENQ